MRALYVEFWVYKKEVIKIDTPNKVYCFFEQSGTFKNEFLKLGIPAEDFDILDEFGQTDHIIDLFAEIDKAYEGKPSVFDSITQSDLIFAFFPCTRFEDQIMLAYRGDLAQIRNKSDLHKLEYSKKLHSELHTLYIYIYICNLFIVLLKKNIPAIIENPYSAQHYLKQYFPIKPSIIDNDRRENGDYFKKPTQFWFINIKPESNVIFEPLEIAEHYKIKYNNDLFKEIGRKTARSMIHPQYARRFILSYILKGT